MRTARPIKAAVTAVATTALLTLSACGSDGDSDKDETSEVQSEASEAPESEPAADEAAAASGDQPAWAGPVTTKGDKITSFKVGDVNVDVYQVGTAPAPKQGNWVDPKTNKPLIAKGDPLVFVNYVVTNNGDSIDLGSSLVNISPRYDDWQYAQGMGGITDNALFEAQGVNTSAVKPGGYQESNVYTLGAGQQYSYGENFHQQAGSKITFEATIVPVDAEGELLHDQRIEGQGTGTIK
ncbi:hypothetical protein [Aeromicrobium duanguangcaii]|uniref:DUF4352 domain-containing protein n=1 Tax=Aeromicrobium duanguangcaii TaxID=2968086 RepID=A0ABY5KHI9_9ACTN|nr:hypothetical protein [Aeromicrobium duanguangcaii]MCD9153447.1 hypothetical protein [Aeromicrobium duanguangcaii]UUI69463.1 hypothetical protein NP095_05005 [Aeromicrobium duanguangcaii]